MAMSLEGRRAIVCGSTQGIGRACAERLAADGCHVTLLARNPDSLAEVRDALPVPAEQRHAWIAGDFADWDGTARSVRDFIEDRGAVDILVNNSGGPPPGLAIDADAVAFLDAMKPHLALSQSLVQAVVPGMREKKFGRIVNIISTSVIMPIRGLGVSNTVRGAMGNWSRTLAEELAGDGITVNNVLPGFTATGRLDAIFQRKAEKAGTTVDKIRQQILASIPAHRLGDPGELAALVAFLVSEEAGYICGVSIPVDGGRLAAT
ncbi:MAG: SDR family oxidoreductase [Phycisphaerales bacterium]|nr:SDR family oxidoreductase [Phycisphaerales bacterium]